MIDKLVNYCNIEFDKNDACNHEFCEEPKTCKICLENIHFGRKRDYDCINLINHYVCTYIYKYSSEVAHLFNLLPKDQIGTKLNILSIGCGPCSDLFAAFHTFNDMDINYHGFDLNNKWQQVHNYINDIFQQQQHVNLNFHYQNVFELYPNIDFEPNCLVLSYVLSHVHKHGNMNNFLRNLKEKIVKNMPINSFILLNDINHNKLARDHFETFCNILKKDNPDLFLITRHHYKGGWKYGVPNRDLELIETIPSEIKIKYKTTIGSKSAQQIIKKMRNDN